MLPGRENFILSKYHPEVKLKILVFVSDKKLCISILSRKLTSRVSASIRVKQKVTLSRPVVAGTLIFIILGVSVFLYLNLASNEQAEARSHAVSHVTDNIGKGFVDLSHLSSEEMKLLTNRDFITDTVQKDYSSVKWLLNKTLSHLTLEVSNIEYEYSLELFDKNGSRVLYFANLVDEKVFVDKLELVPNHEYNYLVRNIAGEMYAGNLLFN